MKYVEPVVRDFSMPAILMDQTYDWHEEGAWLIRELVRIHDQEEKAFELALPGCLQKFWRLLVLNCPPQREAAAGERLNYDRIRTILAYIEMHYGESVRLDEIAEQVHLCKGECCRLFKRYMKMTLFDFILDFRIPTIFPEFFQKERDVRRQPIKGSGWKQHGICLALYSMGWYNKKI